MFSFNRNPWDRLVSAYKNKALNGPYSLWLKTPCKWLKEGMPPLTFPQFTRCIVDAARQYSKYGGWEWFIINKPVLKCTTATPFYFFKDPESAGCIIFSTNRDNTLHWLNLVTSSEVQRLTPTCNSSLITKCPSQIHYEVPSDINNYCLELSHLTVQPSKIGRLIHRTVKKEVFKSTDWEVQHFS